MDAGTEIKTRCGAAVAVPKGWLVRVLGNDVLFEDQDGEVRLWLIETSGTDLDAAIATAWTRVRPGFSPRVRHAKDPPPRRGWEALREIIYETRRR